jgi:hypothetical protein
MYNEMERNEKEVAIMCFKILFQHSPNTTGEDHRNLSQEILYLR